MLHGAGFRFAMAGTEEGQIKNTRDDFQGRENGGDVPLPGPYLRRFVALALP